jgi:filamentous hemagglutinin family protein
LKSFKPRSRRGPRVAWASFSASLLASSALTPALAADPVTLLSPAVLARSAGGAGAAANPTGSVSPLASPSLQAQLALSSANLARAAQALNDMTAAQAAAAGAASQLTLNNRSLSGSAWNGQVLSGLNPVDSDPTQWINADPLTKDTGSATATVKQNAASALLTWQSLDLNLGEKLIFDQQGHSDWIVLNRVVAGPRDASGSRFVASPSQILGSIEAPGSVYVINPNGVVFGGRSQVSVHSFIASSLDVGNPIMTLGERNSFFLNTGILGNGTDVPAASFSYNPDDKVIEGDIVVEAGARISAKLATRSVSPDAGGFVYLFAPNVENRGTISTPAGETLLVAAQAVQLIANAYPDGFLAEQVRTASKTFRAVGVNTILFSGSQIAGGGRITDDPIVWRTEGPQSALISAPGRVTNRGLIDAERGVVILNGDMVTNGSGATGSGVIRANTSITRNGQIFLDGRLELNLSGGTIQILPTDDGETIPQSALGNFVPGSIEMRGTVVSIDSSALIAAPGANVTVSGIAPLSGLAIYPTNVFNSILGKYSPRIYMAQGSTIDVSGLQDVVRPMSDNFLTLKPFGNEFADQPLQRNGALRGQELTVDLRQSGNLGGVNWVGTPIANLTGYADNVQRTIDQLLTKGGNVNLSSPIGERGQIVLRENSVINVGGGYVRYNSARIAASRLITIDGRIVDISRADPLDIFVAVAGVSTLEHPHWGPTTTETYFNPLLSGLESEPGYVEGGNAGAVTLDGSAYVLDGTFYGGVVAGDRQRALGLRPAVSNSLAMPSAASLTISGNNNLTIANTVAPVAVAFGRLDALPGDVIQTTRVSAQKISDAGFAKFSASFSGKLLVESDAALAVAQGGTIGLAGGSVDIEGRLTARSGTIEVDSTAHIAGDLSDAPTTSYNPMTPVRPDLFSLVVGRGAVLDASGLWVNDSEAPPQDLVGGAFINGGSVILRTEARSAVCTTTACLTLPGLGAGVPANVDLTGDVVISAGASIDISSGGRITDHALLMQDPGGPAAGRGGSLSLMTYAGGFSTAVAPQPVTTSGLAATIRLAASDGSGAGNAAALNNAVDAFGFTQGGTLAIQAPSFTIGGEAAAPGGLALSTSFFDGNAFGGYSLTSVANAIAVVPGSQVRLRQRNLLPGSALGALPTGAKVSSFASKGYLLDIVRAPVDLVLSAILPRIPAAPYDTATPVEPSKVAISIGQGAVLQGDPNASITVNVAGQSAYDGGTINGFEPPITAQKAVAEILGTIRVPGGAINLSTTVNARIWLGDESRLDVTGVAVADQRELRFRSGTVLPGGKVTITANDADSSVVGLAGALIDVSGSTGVFDLLADVVPGRNGEQRIATPVWSDAGSISIASPTLLYDGAFAARPGAAGGNGGSLRIISPEVSGPGTEQIVVRQGGNTVPAGLSSTGTLGPLVGTAVFLADRLSGSGIQNLTISMGPTTGDEVSDAQGRFAPGTLTFSGNVTLGGLTHLFLDAGRIALADIVTPADPRGCNVCLDARYVALRGAGNVNRVFPAPGTGVLRVAGDAIDIAAGGFSLSNSANALSLSGVAQANFVSSGDIRLRVPLANATLDLAPGTLPAGELLTAGDVTFDAAQIYPVSAVDFTIKSAATNGTVTFLANAAAPALAPLSAGGQVTVSAARINQSGRLLAPLGTIRLGAQNVGDLAPNDPSTSTLVPTRSVVFGAGSLTSLSLNGLTVPFGQTANETSWSYNSLTGRPLTAPSDKNIVVSSAAINVGAGASIDLRGGGDIQAIEFVPGTGGTRDVLSGRNVYAIIPGYNPVVAPSDLDFAVQRRDASPLAGSQVYLTGAGGLPAGYYTLLPAHYATLTGAYRIALVPGSGDALSYQNQTLPDGTMQIAGRFANGLAGTRDSRLELFDIQSSDTWRKYSEIEQTTGNTFFGAKVSEDSGLPPRLARDAGHAVFNAVNQISIVGQILSAPAAGGRGSRFDIAALDLQVLSPGATARSGYVGLDASQLSALGVDSLLLGGVRSDTAGGETISVVSNSVSVSNDASAPLEGPEIILVTRVESNTVDPNASRALILDPGSVMRAKGVMVDGRQHKVTIGNEIQKLPGNGSLLAVSSGEGLIVERQRVVQDNGSITLGDTTRNSVAPGIALAGNSLTLDTSGQVRTGRALSLNARNIAVSARTINFGASRNNAGINISGELADQLKQAKNLILKTSRTMDFSGNADFVLRGNDSRLILDAANLVSAVPASSNAPDSVTLGANTVFLTNSGDGQVITTAGLNNITIVADEIQLGSGDKSLAGFKSASFVATGLISARDAGSLSGGEGSLTFQTPLFLVGAAASQSISTGGDLYMLGMDRKKDALPFPSGEIGGTFALAAKTVTFADEAVLQAIAGGITITANGGPPNPSVPPGPPRDIVLEAGSKILANGFVATFFDVTRAVGGGAVQLVAKQGWIDADANALIDVSSPAALPGHAGQVTLSAANGHIVSGASLFNINVIGNQIKGDGGGRLSITALSMGGQDITAPAMFDDAIDIHLYRGDIRIASPFKAASLTVTADGGKLIVDDTVDASGRAGGVISLFGKAGVSLTANARLVATASGASEHGGEVMIGTSGNGELDLAGGIVDVSNTANAPNGGRVRLRAPLVGRNDAAIKTVGTVILGATNVTVEAYRVFDTNNSAFRGVIDPLGNPGFFGQCNAGTCAGTLVEFVQNFSLSQVAQQKFSSLPTDILHFQPGIELVNDDLAVNNGDITVAGTWNLGAGQAGFLISREDFIVNKQLIAPKGTLMTDANGVLLPQYAAYKGDLVFAPGVSQITSLFYRVGGKLTGEAGALTLRATRDVKVNNSITDGFFNTRNVFDATYQRALSAWISTVYFAGGTNFQFNNVGGYLIAGANYAAVASQAPVAPYSANANSISPVFSPQSKAPLTSADLFALVEDPGGPIEGLAGKRYRAVDSWSYRITAGADTASANPLAMLPLAVFDDAGTPLSDHGDVVMDGHTQYNVFSVNWGNFTFETPTIIRTGTGSIDVAAGRDFVMADKRAPGVVYTAGRKTVDLADPGFVMRTAEDPLNPGQTVVVPVATNPEGFLKPVVVICDFGFLCNPYGPPTEASYPVGGGHLSLTVGRDIIGFQNNTISIPGTGGQFNNQQFFMPWLRAQGTALSSNDFGPFSPLSGYLSEAGLLFTPSQTSWWIDFGSFGQGLMSVGGDVTVRAGRDIRELSVSLPTTARVSGGLSSTIIDAAGKTVANVPVMHLNESGDLTVIAGRDLKSGTYYEGSGDARIIVGGSTYSSWSLREDVLDPATAHPVSTVLAVDTGRLTLVARGSIDIAGVVSGPSLQNVADPWNAFDVVSQSVSSYGPDSAISLLSVGGNTVTNSLTYEIGLIKNAAFTYNGLDFDTSGYPGIARYPASFEAAAANGDVVIAGSLRLASSQNGNISLLARGSLVTSGINSDMRPLSTGPSLVEGSFDAVNPLAGFGPQPGALTFDTGALLLHESDTVPALFYAATGDIISPSGSIDGLPGIRTPLAWEITKAAKVRAAVDIVDLSFFGQNLQPTDITSIIAGRDLYYTGAWQQLLGVYNNVPDTLPTQNLGGLSIAGPGFLQVQAGRNLGPFVTAAANITATFAGGPADPIGTGIVSFGNIVTVGNRRMFSTDNPTAPDSFANGQNYRMARRGADIVALFGVANGVEYDAVLENYVNPRTETSARDYLTALALYLQTLGYPAMTGADAWTVFQTLPAGLREIFASKVFISELKLPADPGGCCYRDYSVGYSMIETLFPSEQGYTDNDVGKDEKPVPQHTGDLDLLHATIKTLQSATLTVKGPNGAAAEQEVGGDVMVLGPGGGINVGTTALEINMITGQTSPLGPAARPKLSNSSLGVLTLDNGAIDIFTDMSVLVNQSRILTVQGGDILMWSSNGDLDAGRGAKTTIDFKPLSVNFDSTNLQTINLNGLVSGAGIGTIRSTPDAPAASAMLVAPRGTVNAGDAGLRASGNLDILALLVLNAANIAVTGNVSGVPQAVSVNLGALASASASAGQAGRIADDSVAAAGNRAARPIARATPALITVEILGFGDCDPETGRRCAAN